jgi:hypothetical protein
MRLIADLVTRNLLSDVLAQHEASSLHPEPDALAGRGFVTLRGAVSKLLQDLQDVKSLAGTAATGEAAHRRGPECAQILGVLPPLDAPAALGTLLGDVTAHYETVDSNIMQLAVQLKTACTVAF